jgi:hypothetical protein
MINVTNKMCYTVILPVVLNRCGTWSVALREEHSLRVFDKRMLRKLFGPGRKEEKGGWTQQNSEEIHDFKSSPSTIRMIN